jgi:hypothetical protein
VSVVISAVPQKPRQAVVEILNFMRKLGLTLNDLIQIGGEDLKLSNPKRVEKARRVEKCWSLMARLSVCFADLEQAGHFSETIENTRVSETFSDHSKPNEINDLADSAPIGDPQLNPESTE